MNEIKELMEKMEVTTARGRARINGRAISLEPHKQESTYNSKERVDVYTDIARTLAERVRNARSGMTDKELERVEFIREQLYDLAKDVCINIIEQEAKA